MEIKLFFGMVIDTNLSKALSLANPKLLSHLIREDEDFYLKKLIYEDQTYIGKWTLSSSTLEELENLEIHILSIFKQILPDYSFESYNLELIPVIMN